MGVKERRARERENRRETIMNTAKKLFMEKGLSFTTMEDIAQRAELSPATIYLYFKNKDELYASLNLETLHFIHKETKKIFNNNGLGPKEKISALKRAFYRMYEYDPLILRNIMRLQLEDTLTMLSHDLLVQINTIAKDTMTMISGIYDAGVRQGVFEREKGIVVADILWSMFTGLVLYEEAKRRINPEKDFFKSTLDKAFNIFARGIRTKSD